MVEGLKTSRDVDQTTSKHVKYRIRTHKWHNRVNSQNTQMTGILQAIF